MDLRIVNTCNNNCLYCLEQSLREEKKYIDLNNIKSVLQESDEKNLTFYGWNPLLHPELIEIIWCAKKNNFENIWILSNTRSINEKYLIKDKNGNVIQKSENLRLLINKISWNNLKLVK